MNEHSLNNKVRNYVSSSLNLADLLNDDYDGVSESNILLMAVDTFKNFPGRYKNSEATFKSVLSIYLSILDEKQHNSDIIKEWKSGRAF